MISMYFRYLNNYLNNNIRCFSGYMRYLWINCIFILIMFLSKKMSFKKIKTQKILTLYNFEAS